MKKIISLFLIAILVCVMFAGCSQNDKQPNNTSDNTTHSTTENATNEEGVTKKDSIDFINVAGNYMGMQTNVKKFISQIDTPYTVKLTHTGEEFVLKEFTKENINDLYNMTIDSTMYYLTLKFDVGQGAQEFIVLDIKTNDKKVEDDKILSLHFVLDGQVMTKNQKILKFHESTPDDMKEIFGKEDDFSNIVSEMYTYINDDLEYEKTQFQFENNTLSYITLYNYH